MTADSDKISTEITKRLSLFMFRLLKDYAGHEQEMMRLLTAQLGCVIAVTAKDPAGALLFYANRLAQFNWEEVRSDYFANTLGVHNTVPTDKPLCEVKSIGERPRDSVRTDQTTGDPLAKKPE